MKKIPILYGMLLIIIIMLGISFAMFYFSISRFDGFDRWLHVFGGVLSLSIGCLFIYLIALSFSKPVNFFLYSSKKRAEISIENLTWDIIDEKMNPYLNSYLTLKTGRWMNKVFEPKKPNQLDLLILPYFAIKIIEFKDIDILYNFMKNEDYKENMHDELQRIDMWGDFLFLQNQTYMDNQTKSEIFEEILSRMKIRFVEYIKKHITEY